MANLLDYLAWRGDLPLSAVPLCDVDALIFARLSYVPFDGIAEARVPLYMAARQVLASVQLSDAPRACGKEDQQLLTQLLQSPRYADILLDGYENIFDPVRQEQFAALTLHLPDGSAAVAFRGTDGTLVGWKEDFNMAFSTVVPAQLDAVRYLSDVAERTQGGIYLCGHSKGGNLAAWAALHIPAELQTSRLLDAYNNDGPGFARDMVETVEYRRIAHKLHTYIPESSIVGVLLEHGEDYAVIDSATRSVMQHEPLSWSVLGRTFVHLGQRSQMGKLSDDVLREWIGSMTPQEREQFTDALFDVLSLSGKVRTLDDLRSGGLAGGAALLKQYAGADEEKKRIISEIFRRLAVDVKDELKKAAEESLENVKNALTSLTRPEK